MQMTRRNILYLDDEKNNLNTFKAGFREYYNVFTAGSVDEAREILKKTEVPVVISDQRMPDMQGTKFLEQVMNEFPDTVRMILTGYSDMDVLMDAIHRKVIYNYFFKPFAEQELKIVIDNAIEVYDLRKQARALKKKFGEDPG
jgi:DNA-binding NtrC family response regulator